MKGMETTGGHRSARIRGSKNQQITVLGKQVPGGAKSKQWLGKDWCVWQAVNPNCLNPEVFPPAKDEEPLELLQR